MPKLRLQPRKENRTTTIIKITIAVERFLRILIKSLAEFAAGAAKKVG